MNLLTNILTMTWQQTWELIAWTMCYFLATGTVVALAGALLRFLCKHLPPQIRYTVSLAVFATLAMLPFGIALGLAQRMPVTGAKSPLVIDLAHTPITMSPVEKSIELKNITLVETNIVETPTPSAVPFVVAIALAHQNSGSMAGAIQYLPWLWLLGTPFTFLLLATGLLGSNRLRKQCTQLTEGPIIKTLERLRTTLAVSQHVALAINERIATPILIGIVRPLILLPPAALTGWSPEQLEMVLLHELAHVRRWDNLVNFGQRLVESLLFFHPAVWWVSRWVRRDREECCDAVVVARTAKPQAYAELLVALATPPPLAGLAMAQHPLAGRIRRILHLEEEKMLITRSTLGLVGFFVVALLGIVLWQPVTPTLAQEPNTPVAPGSAGGLSEDKATKDTKSTEKLRLVEAIFESPYATFADRRQGEIWIETQTALIKSDFVLRQAMKPFANDGTQYPVPTLKWLQDRLKVRFMPAAVILGLEAKKGDRIPTGVCSNYLQAIGKSYMAEWKKSAKFANVNQPSPFPTLEAQRSADLAYKLLGVELEPLNKEELARVKAMEFAGGLRVAHTILSKEGISTTRSVALPGDLLVGLHIWPTTSLADVKKLLERDDLKDLSPLKFYVIRRTESQEHFGGYGAGGGLREKTIPVDKLATGRIKVNVAAFKKEIISGPGNLAPGDQVQVRATGIYPDQPLDDVYTIEPGGTLPLGPTYGRIKVLGLTVIEAEKVVKKHLEELFTEVGVQIVLYKKAALLQATKKNYVNNLSATDREEINLRYAQAAYEIAQKSYTSSLNVNKRVKGAVDGIKLRRLRAEVEHARLKIERSKALIHDFTLEKNAQEKQPITLLYDNKTFDQWRSQWKDELKIEKRTEAIKAMAAFGRAGYGKEAAEAILDVAGEYDFRNWESGDKAVQSLKGAIIKALTNHDGLDADIWAPLLIDRWESNPSRWRGLVGNLLANAYDVKPELQQRLLDIAVNPKNSVEVRAAALKAVGSNDYKLEKPTTVELIRSAINGKEADLIIQAMNVTNFRHLDKLPEQLVLFFHPSEKVRRYAAISIVGADTENGRRVVNHLLNILDDPGRAADHLRVIEAISWNVTRSDTFNRGLREMKADLIERLRYVLVEGDKTLLPETIRALSKLTAEGTGLVIRIANDLGVSGQRKKELEEAVKLLDAYP